MDSEPVIVVDQENCINEEDENTEDLAGNGQECPDAAPQDPFFLSPFRDMRKRSLPTPQCTSGITASQVIYFEIQQNLILLFLTGSIFPAKPHLCTECLKSFNMVK